MRARWLRSTLLVVPAAALALASGVVPAQAANPTRWRIVATVPASDGGSELTGVAVADQRHAWAVGFAVNTKTTTFAPVVMNWNGSAWTQVSLPAGVVKELGGAIGPLLVTVGASSPSNMWAFTPSGGWLRWNGTWTAGQITKALVFIDATAVLGPGDVWAFGGAMSGAKSSAPYAAHYNGTGWKRYPVPGSNGISAASAVSSRDIWATLGQAELSLGSGGKGGGLVHWYRGRWHPVTNLPAALRNTFLGSVLARSDKNVWVGGAVKNGKHGTTEAIGHWNGRKWTVTMLPARATAKDYSVASMATDGAGGIWALGICLTSACSAGSPWRLWHEAAGRWSGPTQPRLSRRATLLDSLAAAGHSVWAVGAIKVGSSANGIIALWGRVPS